MGRVSIKEWLLKRPARLGFAARLMARFRNPRLR